MTRIDRRRFLVGSVAGLTASVGLPYLEALHAPRRARAQSSEPPKRLVILMHKHGTLLEGVGNTANDDWTPAGVGTGFELSPLLAPLEPLRDKIAVLSGLWNPGGRNGHELAGQGVLTCSKYNQGEDPLGPSIDQVVGAQMAQEVTLPYRTLNLAVTEFAVDVDWVFGHEDQIIWDQSRTPVPQTVNPFNLYNRLFSTLQVDSSEPPPELSLLDRLRMRRQSVLDAVVGELTALSGRLPAQDRARLDEHATHIRQLEAQLSGAAAAPQAGCARPEVNVNEAWHSDPRTYEHEVSRSMIDQMVMALACDLTRVTTLYYGNSQGPTFPWLDVQLPYNGAEWHGMVHDFRTNPGARPVLFEGFRWYTEQFLYLLQRMEAHVESNGRTMLDNSLVVWVSEFGDGNMHISQNMPVVLAGGLNGAIPMGRHVHFDDVPPPFEENGDRNRGTNIGQVYTTIQNLFGVSGNFFNASEYPAVDLG